MKLAAAEHDPANDTSSSTDGCAAPSGPGELAIFQPGGIFESPFNDAPRASQRDYTSVVDENKVICYECKHSWIFWKYAPTQNVKPDGTPYRQREGYCMLPAQQPGGAPLPLEERFVLTCNNFKRRINSSAARAMAMGMAMGIDNEGAKK